MHNYLWFGKTGEANAWYHISLIAHARSVSKLYVVRHKKPLREVRSGKVEFVESGSSDSFIIELLLLIRRGLSVLRRNKIDVIVTFNVFPYGFVAYLLALLFRKKLILCFIGADYNSHFQKPLTRALILKSLRYSDVVIYKGHHIKSGLIKYGVAENKLYRYPHFVDDEFLEGNGQISERIYELITVSQLIPRKNIQMLIEALHRLKRDGLHPNLCIVGEGPLYQKLRTLVEKLNLSDTVYFAGLQKDVKSFIDKSKIFVQTSSGEGLSLSLVEAISSGLVPIVTEAGSERDVIIDGINGRLIRKNNIEDLVNAIKEVLEDDYYTVLRTNVLKDRHKYSLTNASLFINSILERLEYDDGCAFEY
jgi:glycosyltransferase involved in cell wall biosynthesis